MGQHAPILNPSDLLGREVLFTESVETWCYYPMKKPELKRVLWGTISAVIAKTPKGTEVEVVDKDVKFYIYIHTMEGNFPELLVKKKCMK